MEAGPSGVDLLKMRRLWFRKASAASLILVVDPNSISLSASVFLCRGLWAFASWRPVVCALEQSWAAGMHQGKAWPGTCLPQVVA